MKTILKTLLVLLILLTTIQCSKDESTPEPIAQPNPDPTPEPENNIPTAAILVSPEANAINVAVNPTFTWEAAADADGDAITYEVYVDTSSDPSTLIGTTTEIFYESTQRLGIKENFNWKVVAKDNNGGESESAISNFETRDILFSNATQDGGFPARSRFAVTIFQDKIWISGGFQGNNIEMSRSNDIWNSSDGVNWTQVTEAAPWSRRMAHVMLTFDDKLWVIGGIDAGFPPDSRLADVWNSEDGINWNLVTDSAGFGKIFDHTVTVYDNKMWIIGNSEVWFSEDGVVWTFASEGAIGPYRKGHSTVVFNNRLWVIGGAREGSINVISSANGISWEIENDAPQFVNEGGFRRSEHSCVVFDNKIWLIGGFNEVNNGSDIWYSEDGKDWVLSTDETAFSGRVSQEALLVEGKIWVLGGDDLQNSEDSLKNDVWFID